jgi:hypothetical protein
MCHIPEAMVWESQMPHAKVTLGRLINMELEHMGSIQGRYFVTSWAFSLSTSHFYYNTVIYTKMNERRQLGIEIHKILTKSRHTACHHNVAVNSWRQKWKAFSRVTVWEIYNFRSLLTGVRNSRCSKLTMLHRVRCKWWWVGPSKTQLSK